MFKMMVFVYFLIRILHKKHGDSFSWIFIDLLRYYKSCKFFPFLVRTIFIW